MYAVFSETFWGGHAATETWLPPWSWGRMWSPAGLSLKQAMNLPQRAVFFFVFLLFKNSSNIWIRTGHIWGSVWPWKDKRNPLLCWKGLMQNRKAVSGPVSQKDKAKCCGHEDGILSICMLVRVTEDEQTQLLILWAIICGKYKKEGKIRSRNKQNNFATSEGLWKL